MVTKCRNLILIDNIELLRNSFKTVKKKYNFEIYGIVILPDHVHMILFPEIVHQYPSVIASIKWHFSRHMEPVFELMSESNFHRREKGIWQRRYYEHTIRDEEELYKYLNYIHYNPVKHGYTKNVKDWEFSSFQKFADMGYYIDEYKCFDDTEHFEDLD